MFKHFDDFGDCMSFDITYKVCSYNSKLFTKDEKDGNGEREGEYEAKSKEKDWNLGVFSVFRQDCKPLVCGMCLILQERVRDFENLFQMFFKMTNSFPQSIITDQQQAVMTALQNFKNHTKLKFCHLLDQFHMIRNAGRSIKKNEELKKLFKRLVYTNSIN